MNSPGYHDLHRLTRETCVASQGSYRMGHDYSYTYDAAGNRTCKTEPAGSRRYETYYSYSARNELGSLYRWQIVQEWNEETEEWEDVWYYQGGCSYSYDWRGNLTAKSQYDSNWEEVYEWAYDWSSDDKMTRVAYGRYSYAPDHVVQYKYDLLGRRVAKKLDSGNWRWYFYDGLQVIAEGTATNDKMYYTTNGGAIAGIIARDNNGTKLFYHFDRLGNVMAVTDSNGRAYAVYTMEAFGNLLQVGTSNGYGYYSSQSDPQPYHLTTKEYDPDTGLYFFNARWYDAATGRFLSHNKQKTVNPFEFCLDNPLRHVDVDGLRISLPRGPVPDAIAGCVLGLSIGYYSNNSVAQQVCNCLTGVGAGAGAAIGPWTGAAAGLVVYIGCTEVCKYVRIVQDLSVAAKPPDDECDKPGRCCHQKCWGKMGNLDVYEACMTACAAGRI